MTQATTTTFTDIDAEIRALEKRLKAVADRVATCPVDALLGGEGDALTKAEEVLRDALRAQREKRARLVAGLPEPVAPAPRQLPAPPPLPDPAYMSRKQMEETYRAPADLPEERRATLEEQMDLRLAADAESREQLAGLLKIPNLSAAVKFRQADFIFFRSALDRIDAFARFVASRTRARDAALEERIAALEGQAEALQRAAASDPMRYRGLWEAGMSYPPNSVVTDHGSAWVALRWAVAGDRPGSAGSAFALMVKRGRDGKNAGATG